MPVNSVDDVTIYPPSQQKKGHLQTSTPKPNHPEQAKKQWKKVQNNYI